MKIVISSGHGLKVPGAIGIINEVTEARRVVDRVAENLRGMGVEVVTFHDDVSEDQSENLNRIVDFHEAQGARDYDISVHFNCYDGTASGTEVLYLNEEDLAEILSSAIADSGHFIDRGAKLRDDLYFLNSLPRSVLIETCFDVLQAKCVAITAIEVMNQKGVKLPLMVQITPDDRTQGETLLPGTEIQAALTTLLTLTEIDAIGLNCSVGPDLMLSAVKTLSEGSDRIVSVLPNAGLPLKRGDETYFPLQPADLAEWHRTHSRHEIYAKGKRVSVGHSAEIPSRLVRIDREPAIRRK